jgi:SAM-dependent methyltransferase
VARTLTAAVEARPNYRKHRSRNPIQRWLLRNFYREVAVLANEALSGRSDPLVLDVGAGEAFVAAYLKAGRFRYVGVDPDPAAAAYAVSVFGVGYVIGDGRRLPVRTRAADLVLCLEVLEHLPDPDAALAELCRVGRFVLISVPHQPWFALANLIRGKNLRRLGDDPDHRQFWTAGRFLRWAGRRLSIDRVRFPFPWLVLLGHPRSA